MPEGCQYLQEEEEAKSVEEEEPGFHSMLSEDRLVYSFKTQKLEKGSCF